MLDFIWFLMMAISFVFALFKGTGKVLASSLLNGVDSSVQLIISTSGMLCFWSGILAVAKSSSVNSFLGKILSPLLSRLFNSVDANSKAMELICLNISANLLGLGNAATPLGLNAMQELRKNNDNPLKATDDMILFVVLNTASLQIIPTTLITYRTAYNSSAPFEILPCIWLSSVAALAVGIIVAKILNISNRRYLNCH